MERWDELTNVFREVFDDPALTLTPETTANDVDGWDSISHATLIVAIETRFKIRFDTKELLRFRNVGDLHRALLARIGSPSA